MHVWFVSDTFFISLTFRLTHCVDLVLSEFATIIGNFEDFIHAVFFKSISKFSRKFKRTVASTAYGNISISLVEIETCGERSVAYIIKFIDKRFCFISGDFPIKGIKGLSVCTCDHGNVVNALHAAFNLKAVYAGFLQFSKMIDHAEIF